MEPSKLRARSMALAKEAQNLAAVITQAPLEKTCAQIVTSLLRRKMVADLDELVKDIEQKVQHEENEIQTYTFLHAGKKVWMEFFEIKEGISYRAVGIRSESAAYVIATVKQDDSSVRYLRPSKCVDLIQNLRRDILNGVYDEELNVSVLKLVYNALK